MNCLNYDDAQSILTWSEAVDAIRAGHLLPKPDLRDSLIGPKNGLLLNRTARIEKIGYGVKVESVFNRNAFQGLPNTHGVVLVYASENGVLRGIIDSHIVTDLKTVADSVLGAMLLARKDSKHLVIIGAGRVAANLAKAYYALFPKLEKISIWARRIEQAQALVAKLQSLAISLTATSDLPDALMTADIVSSATMAEQPIILGEWIRQGTHIDLIGAFTPIMREADDTLMAMANLYVDHHETTWRIGEISIPMESGAIPLDHVKGDLYDLMIYPQIQRRTPQEITVFKNGGGAHLDLMVADRMLSKIGR